LRLTSHTTSSYRCWHIGMEQKKLKIGIIADTHGEIKPRVLQLFAGIDYILHAGDIGSFDVLLTLQALAPVTAVYGNMDGFDLRRRVRAQERIELLGYSIEIEHIFDKAALLSSTNDDIKIHGHTHQAEIARYGKVLTVNPGSASRPKRMKKPSVAFLYLEADKEPKAEIIFLG
jgi:putative phosphoesterase